MTGQITALNLTLSDHPRGSILTLDHDPPVQTLVTSPQVDGSPCLEERRTITPIMRETGALCVCVCVCVCVCMCGIQRKAIHNVL